MSYALVTCFALSLRLPDDSQESEKKTRRWASSLVNYYYSSPATYVSRSAFQIVYSRDLSTQAYLMISLPLLPVSQGIESLLGTSYLG